MGEIRIVSPGKTRGYPYPVCKKKLSLSILEVLYLLSLSNLHKWHIISWILYLFSYKTFSLSRF